MIEKNKRVIIDFDFEGKKPVLLIKIPYDEELVNIARSIEGARWNRLNQYWSTPWREATFNEIKFAFGLVAHVDDSLFQEKIVKYRFTQFKYGQLSHETLLKIEKYKRWMQSRRYSENSINVYSDALLTFLNYYHDKAVASITNEDLIAFNNDYILKRKLSSSYQNQFVSAMKLFFRKIENTAMEIDVIHRPKRAKTLPNVLSKEEVKNILNSTQNLKHKAMLSLTYACGLRSSELLKLEFEHVDSKRGLLIIRGAKGNKDRIAPLSKKIVDLLDVYYLAFKPIKFVFEGARSGEPYDERSLQNVIKQNVMRAGIKKPVTLHWLRHSYATHLLENGTDLRYIQEILGHKSSRTTEIYTHVSKKSIQNIASPFDDL